jgi:hypothetical protein
MVAGAALAAFLEWNPVFRIDDFPEAMLWGEHPRKPFLTAAKPNQLRLARTSIIEA